MVREPGTSEKINIRSKIDPIWGGPVPLADALGLEVPNKKCYVYRLSIPSTGTHSYIGFTSQNPEDCLAQHLESAREGSKKEVSIKLREFGLLHDFEILSEHQNEILGLVAEVAAIKAYKPDLNLNEGGEGPVYKLKKQENGFGENILYVLDKKNVSLAKKQKWKHFESTLGRIQTRYYREIMNRLSSYVEFEALSKMSPTFDLYGKFTKLDTDGDNLISELHSTEFRSNQNLKYRRQIYDKVLICRNFVKRVEQYQNGDEALSQYVEGFVVEYERRVYLHNKKINKLRQKPEGPSYYYFYGQVFSDVISAKRGLERISEELKEAEVPDLDIVASYKDGILLRSKKHIAISASGAFINNVRWSGLD